MNPTIQPNGDATYVGSQTTVASVPGIPTPTTIPDVGTLHNAQAIVTNPDGSYVATNIASSILPVPPTVAGPTTTFDNDPTVATNPNGSTTTTYQQPAVTVPLSNESVAPFYINRN